jgi:IS605 OrfB family transposase
MRRTRSGGCCARAASGHTAAAPPISVMNSRHFKKYEADLAKAQRARNKKRTRTIHAKIANARRHFLHVQSTRIVQENALIVVGNVNGKSLPYRAQRKSALDASWSEFRSMFRYKASRHGAQYIEAEETDSSATCSACGARSGPQGQKELRVRAWVCGCGTSHDRDVNSAVNLLLGAEHRPPVVEIPVL